MLSQLYTYRAEVLEVYDGDTITVLADLGFKISIELPVRLIGINTRELAEPGGKQAKNFLSNACPIGSKVLLQSLGPDKFGGRWLGKIQLPNGMDVAQYLIQEGYAAKWDGKGPRPLPAWPIISAGDKDDII